MNNASLRTLAKQATAELFGTLLLALTVEVLVFGSKNYSSTFQSLYIPLVIGGVLAVLVSVFGSISGANFNPAVTLAY